MDLEFHPYFPEQRPHKSEISDRMGEKHQQMLEGELHIAIINTDSISPEVGIIKVKWGWFAT